MALKDAIEAGIARRRELVRQQFNHDRAVSALKRGDESAANVRIRELAGKLKDVRALRSALVNVADDATRQAVFEKIRPFLKFTVSNDDDLGVDVNANTLVISDAQ